MSEQLEAIKRILEPAKKGFKTTPPNMNVVNEYTTKLFLHGHIDWLVTQAELKDHYKEQIDITQRRNEKLEQELITAHAPIGHLEKENEQLREALRDIVLNYKVVMDGSQDEGYDFVEDVYDTARQALEEGNHARD